MSYAHHNFPRQRPLTKAEAGAMAREMIGRASAAVRDGVVLDRPAIAVGNLAVTPPRPGLIRQAWCQMRRRLRYTPHLEIGLVAFCLAISATGALIEQIL